MTLDRNTNLMNDPNTDIILTFVEDFVSEMTPLPYRLPKTSAPLSYKLELTTNVHTGALPFSGNVDIRVVLLEDTDHIVLHSQNLEILSIVVHDELERPVEGITFLHDVEFSFLIIRFNEVKLFNSEFNIVIDFTGNLPTAVQGFYRTSYGTGTDIK